MPGHHDLTIGDCLVRAADTLLHRAVLEGTPVLVRVPGVEVPHQRGLAALEQELQLSRELEGPDLLLPERLVTHVGSPVLVYSTAGLHSLEMGVGHPPQDVLPVVEMAAGATRGLERLHDHGLIHAQVGPAAILLREGGGVLISTFGRARPAGQPASASLPMSRLPWASPEETGRVPWVLAPPSDLYSLGVVLYRLLAGHLPLASTDAMGWIHAHVTHRPVPLAQVNPAVPDSLSRIVERLLAKDPASRYQTTYGLRHDLLAVLRGEELQTLGAWDIVDRVGVPTGLHGRDVELEALATALQPSNTPRVVVVDGGAGAGKTSLVNHALEQLHGAWVCRSKADLARRHVPLHALVQTVDELVRLILMAPPEDSATLRERVRAQVSPLGQAVVELIPEAAALLGEQPPLPELHPEAHRQRLHRAVSRLFRAVPTPTRPLVLFCDDLQWTDRATLDLLLGLLREGSLPLTLVIALRPVHAPHPVGEFLDTLISSGIPVQDIHLGGLSTAAVGSLIHEALGAPIEGDQALVEAVAARTGGNPLLAVQLLYRAREEGDLGLDRDAARWTWSGSLLLVESDSSDALARSRLDALPAQCSEILGAAGVASRSLTLATLSAVVGSEVEALWRALVPATEARLVLVEGQGEEARLVFTHDSIQEAAARMVPAQRQPGLHLDIATVLAGEYASDKGSEALYDAAYHLLRAHEGGLDLTHSVAHAQLLTEAGRRALASGSPDLAQPLLALAIHLAGPSAWDEQPGIARAVLSSLAVIESLRGASDRALELCDEVIAHTPDLVSRVPVSRLRVGILSTAMRTREAIDEGLSLLHDLGVAMPADPASLQPLMADVHLALDGRDLMDIAQGPEAADPAVRAAVEVIGELIPVVFMARPELFPALSLRAMALVARHGTCPAGAVATVCYGIVLGAVGLHDDGYRAGQLGYRLLERHPQDPTASAVLVQYPVFILHHHEPVAHVIPLLEEGLRRSLEAGALPTFGYCANQRLLHALLAGHDLARLDDEVDGVVTHLMHLDQVLAGQAAAVCGQVVANLRHGSPEPHLLVGARFDITAMVALFEEHHWHTGVYIAQAMAAWVALLYNRPDLAWQAVEAARPLAASTMGMYVQAIVEMVGALSALALAHTASPAQREVLVAEAISLRASLEARAALCPANHAHRLQWIDAERSRLEGEVDDALEAYSAAAEAAERGGLGFDAALAHESACALCLELDRVDEAATHLDAASDLYRSWGAKAKLEDLASRYASTLGVHRDPSAVSLLQDLDLVTAAADALAGELSSAAIGRIRLARCVEISGARCGALLDASGEILAEAGPAASAAPSPAVVRAAVRSGQPVVVHESRSDARFSQDPVLSDATSRAILATPILLSTGADWMLYLDNDLVPSVFGPLRVSLVRLLVALGAARLSDAASRERLASTTQQLHTTSARMEAHRTQLEAAIEEHTSHLVSLNQVHELVLASMYEGLCVVDTHGRITFANHGVQRMAGWVADDLVGRPLHGTLHRGRLPCALCTVDDTTRSPQEAEFTCLDGLVLPVDVTRRPLFGPGGEVTGAVLTFTDASERKRLQGQLLHAQKMEALGRFAGGLAHQLNNLLTPVVAGASMLTMARLDDFERKTLDNLDVAATRASELVRQALAFSRRSALFRDVTDLTPLVTEVGTFLTRTIDRAILVDVRSSPTPCLAAADPGQVHQVLLNLTLNAQDALLSAPVPEPRITITLAQELVGPRDIPDDTDASPGVYNAIAVADNGPGIEPGVAEMIFEPFFTTRETARRTGLGLSAAYGIAHSHGGWIACETAPGHGATFRWYLPIHESAKVDPQ